MILSAAWTELPVEPSCQDLVYVSDLLTALQQPMMRG